VREDRASHDKTKPDIKTVETTSCVNADKGYYYTALFLDGTNGATITPETMHKDMLTHHRNAKLSVQREVCETPKSLINLLPHCLEH